jgi:hypothetical protein
MTTRSSTSSAQTQNTTAQHILISFPSTLPLGFLTSKQIVESSSAFCPQSQAQESNFQTSNEQNTKRSKNVRFTCSSSFSTINMHNTETQANKCELNNEHNSNQPIVEDENQNNSHKRRTKVGDSKNTNSVSSIDMVRVYSCFATIRVCYLHIFFFFRTLQHLLLHLTPNQMIGSDPFDPQF